MAATVPDDNATRRQEVEHFFDEYVKWMRSDIARELSWVRTDAPRSRREWIERRILRLKPRGAGNLLCALGLLVYTEALGRVWRWNLKQAEFFNLVERDGSTFAEERPRANFHAAFDRLNGGEYGRWRRAWEKESGLNVYDVLRNGMVHEYRPKVGADMHLGHAEPRGVDYRGGRMRFFVVPYHGHFSTLADELRAEVFAVKEPSLPIPYMGPKRLFGSPGGSVGASSG